MPESEAQRRRRDLNRKIWAARRAERERLGETPSFLTNLEYRSRLHVAVYAQWSDPEAQTIWHRAYQTWLEHTREGKDPEEAYTLTVLGLAQGEPSEGAS